MSKLIRNLEKSLKKDRSKRKYFYASATGKCRRALYFDWIGAEKMPYDGNTMLRFKAGDLYHQLVIELLRSTDNVQVVDAETVIDSKKYDEIFHGRIDAIIRLPSDDGLRIIDIKSTKSVGFRYLQRGQKPSESYITQVQLYMLYEDINNGSLLFINKDTQELFEYEVERDDKKILALIEELQQLREDFENNKIPDKPDKSKWPYDKCEYCNYRLICNDY